jgi:hypothetical protein
VEDLHRCFLDNDRTNFLKIRNWSGKFFKFTIFRQKYPQLIKRSLSKEEWEQALKHTNLLTWPHAQTANAKRLLTLHAIYEDKFPEALTLAFSQATLALKENAVRNTIAACKEKSPFAWLKKDIDEIDNTSPISFCLHILAKISQRVPHLENSCSRLFFRDIRTEEEVLEVIDWLKSYSVSFSLSFWDNFLTRIAQTAEDIPVVEANTLIAQALEVAMQMISQANERIGIQAAFRLIKKFQPKEISPLSSLCAYLKYPFFNLEGAKSLLEKLPSDFSDPFAEDVACALLLYFEDKMEEEGVLELINKTYRRLSPSKQQFFAEFFKKKAYIKNHYYSLSKMTQEQFEESTSLNSIHLIYSGSLHLIKDIRSSFVKLFKSIFLGQKVFDPTKTTLEDLMRLKATVEELRLDPTEKTAMRHLLKHYLYTTLYAVSLPSAELKRNKR